MSTVIGQWEFPFKLALPQSMATRDEVQPLFKQCESCHRDKEETAVIAKFKGTLQ